LETKSDGSTDQELVLKSHPDARVERGTNPQTGVTEYRLVYATAPGQRDARTAWFVSEARAWQAACARLGLRTVQP
jgi:hypothetical protein